MPDSRQHDLRFEEFGDAVGVPQSIQARGSQYNSVIFPCVELSKPCVDIASHRNNMEVRKTMPELHLPPQATGTDTGAGGHFSELPSVGNEGVTVIFAFRYRDQLDAVGKIEREIFHAVNREVDPPVEKGFVELLREKPFSSDLGQGNVQDRIARGLEDDEFDREVLEDTFESSLGPVCLPHSERASAGTQLERATHPTAPRYFCLTLKIFRTRSRYSGPFGS